VSGPGQRAEAATVERLWLDRLHEIGRPIAHELRNALNGVAVNLEVVRGRAARPDAPASGVAPFAEAAAGQLEALAGLTDALLALVRPVPEPPDVGTLADRLATLLGATARGEGGALSVRVTPDGSPVRAGVDGEALRLLLATLLDAAFERRAELLCEVDGSADPTVRLSRADGAPMPAVPAEVRSLAERLHVRLDGAPAAWKAVLPAAPPAAGL
jgi:signal transduction histidine kinase